MCPRTISPSPSVIPVASLLRTHFYSPYLKVPKMLKCSNDDLWCETGGLKGIDREEDRLERTWKGKSRGKLRAEENIDERSEGRRRSSV